MQLLNPIAAVSLAGLAPHQPGAGEPICERVDPTTLFVDHEYQRTIGEKGRRQIRQIIENFCWTKFKPPICAYAEHDGRTILKVLDGQHTAIAAASNPHISLIPVMIVEAPDTQSQAAAFVGQNTQRLGVTPLQIHQAAVLAQEENALDVQNVCNRAGVRVLHCLPGSGRYKPGDTIAIAAIRGLVSRRTSMGARVILEVLAKAHLAPITALHIKAADYLMSDKELSLKFDPEDLTKTIGDLYLTAEDEARVQAKTMRIPEWRALAMIWFRKTKKKRQVMRLVA
ncbi:MAG: hypothetical protein E5Y51_18095 [Mesorhizobium sp.]|nr:MAG: hypothetical protein E5Y51_18095 [Mesorhizobium sp.]